MKGRWLSLAILALALGLRLAWLGVKPAHFDEGVNGWFVDQMTRDGFYHYDPTNFHGPLHFYLLFVAQTLLGRHEWALRLPLALVSTACVGLMLAFRTYFGKGVCQLAALCMAISPGFVFYGRYAIHESELVFAMMLLVWGLLGLCHFGTRRHLWAAGLGFTGMVLTKETWVIHAVAFTLGSFTLRWFETFLPSRPFTPVPPRWRRKDALQVAGVCALAIVFFYTGGFLDWPGPQLFDKEGHPLPRGSLCGLYEAYQTWVATGAHGAGHEKPLWYWLELMSRYEWPALLGSVAAAVVGFQRADRHLRWLAISTGGALCAYTLVAYKTPWCLLAIMWPFHLTFAVGVFAAMRWLDRWVVGIATALLLASSLASSLVLNFRKYADESEPYVYVQTRLDIHKLLGPLRALVARDPMEQHLAGFIVMAETYPLPWLLADFTGVQILNLADLPEDVSAAQFFLVSEEYREDIEKTLRGSWFRDTLTLRGSSGASQVLYLRPAKFGTFFPGRTPEFTASEP